MSPVKVKKVNGYQVSTPGGIKAKHTTRAKAMRQRRLLYGVEHGWRPTGKKARDIKGMSEHPVEQRRQRKEIHLGRNL